MNVSQPDQQHDQDDDAHAGALAEQQRLRWRASFNGRIVTVPPIEVLDRRGKLEWRWIGKRGAGSSHHPVRNWSLATERAIKTAIADALRIWRPAAATAAATTAATAKREAKGLATQMLVLELAKQPLIARPASGMASKIAKKLKIHVSQVRRHLKKNAHHRAQRFTP